MVANRRREIRACRARTALLESSADGRSRERDGDAATTPHWVPKRSSKPGRPVQGRHRRCGTSGGGGAIGEAAETAGSGADGGAASGLSCGTWFSARGGGRGGRAGGVLGGCERVVAAAAAATASVAAPVPSMLKFEAGSAFAGVDRHDEATMAIDGNAITRMISSSYNWLPRSDSPTHDGRLEAIAAEA